MDLFIAIAMLCRVSAGGVHGIEYIDRYQVDCQQRYLHCINTKSDDKQTALSKCIMERKT